MPQLQQKVTHYMKTHKDLKLNGTKCSKDVKLKMTDMLELSDKDEAVVIRMLQQKIANMFKTNKRQPQQTNRKYQWRN